MCTKLHLPPWLHVKRGPSTLPTQEILKNYHVKSVCEEAKCPNRLECFGKKRATFLALGSKCTRSCPFCNIESTKKGSEIDENEPQNIAQASQKLKLKVIVITMVTRDDLQDGGAHHIAAIIQEVRKTNPTSLIEVLTSDFQGKLENIDLILQAKPDIFNHNIETVHSLSPKIRNKADYDRSLKVLSHAKSSNLVKKIKSGLLLGFGEKEEEVKSSLNDLLQVGCDIVTIGQYLSPSPKHLKVTDYIHPDQFKAYADYGHQIGIHQVISAPLIRSSYYPK
jgi:lipoyl synthase